MVYGGRILFHIYEYYASGFLKSASIRSDDDDDGGVIFFDENGKRLAPEWGRNENIATCNE
jgi:antitoxin component YwqK of YwqJK toxin-antitoxin module